MFQKCRLLERIHKRAWLQFGFGLIFDFGKWASNKIWCVFRGEMKVLVFREKSFNRILSHQIEIIHTCKTCIWFTKLCTPFSLIAFHLHRRGATANGALFISNNSKKSYVAPQRQSATKLSARYQRAQTQLFTIFNARACLYITFKWNLLMP